MLAKTYFSFYVVLAMTVFLGIDSLSVHYCIVQISSVLDFDISEQVVLSTVFLMYFFST